MRLTRPILYAVAVLALLGSISGCGGGSASSPSSTSTSTVADPAKPPAETGGEATGESPRATVIKEGDAICGATDEVTATLQEEFTKVTNPGVPDYESKLAGLLVRIVVIGRTEAEELAALEPPPGEAATYERWLTVGQEGLSDFEAAAGTLKKEGKSPKFAKTYEQGQSKLTQANKIASDFGFKVCGGQRI